MRAERESIFESTAQHLKAIDPAQIVPIWDRCLLEDLPDPEKIGSLFVPDSAEDRGVGGNGRFRLARVVAVGRGDKFIEKGFDFYGDVRREPLGECAACKGSGMSSHKQAYQSPDPGKLGPDWCIEDCPACHGDGLARWPMNCKPGDVVIIERRREAEVYIEGTKFTLAHEEQAILAILDGFDPSNLDKAWSPYYFFARRYLFTLKTIRGGVRGHPKTLRSYANYSLNRGQSLLMCAAGRWTWKAAAALAGTDTPKPSLSTWLLLRVASTSRSTGTSCTSLARQ